MRFSFNVAGASTGRWSSSENPMWTGTNGQNITDEMRRMFVADPGRNSVTLICLRQMLEISHTCPAMRATLRLVRDQIFTRT